MAHPGHAIRSSAAARVSTVRQMRSDTRTALARYRAMREASRYAVKRSLQENRAAVIASLRAGGDPDGAGTERPTFGSLAPPLDGRPHGPIEHRSVWNFVTAAAPPQAAEAPRDPLVTHVLRVIEAHPDGIRALDVGNALGIDWRRVPAVARELVEEGVIEQVAQDYYPVAKASGAW